MNDSDLRASIADSVAAGRILPATVQLIVERFENDADRAALAGLLTRHQFRPGRKSKLDDQADAVNRFHDLRAEFGRREAILRIKAECPQHLETVLRPNGRVRAHAREKKKQTNDLSALKAERIGL